MSGYLSFAFAQIVLIILVVLIADRCTLRISTNQPVDERAQPRQSRSFD